MQQSCTQETNFLPAKGCVNKPNTVVLMVMLARVASASFVSWSTISNNKSFEVRAAKAKPFKGG